MTTFRRRTWRAGAALAVLAAVGLTGLTVPERAARTYTETEYTVLAEDGADPVAARTAVEVAGGRVVSTNPAVRSMLVQAPAAGFIEAVSADPSVLGASHARAVGRTGRPGPDEADALAEPGRTDVRTVAATATAATAGRAGTGLDPLDAKRWGLSMTRSDAARRVQPGRPGVLVGILDTGIDGRHPDLAANVDAGLSRNFAPDIPTDPAGAVFDGPCEVPGCLDPVDRDDNGHGTHVAGIVAAAANGYGISGVAPGVRLVNIRAGQDAGLLFLQPVLDGLTYGADIGLDVINMSFYVDPWLYNCENNPADPPEARIEQRTVVAAMTRALRYAHGKGVTLVAAVGNNHEDMGHPRTDVMSPDFPPGAARPRPIDNRSCLAMPLEAPHVLGVSALGPSGTKADYSNYGIEQTDLAAPGGWADDLPGTPAHGSNDNKILSTESRTVLDARGYVTPDGTITPKGAAKGIVKVCATGGCGFYGYRQGASMATPHVSGVAALVVSQFGRDVGGRVRMAPDAVERILSRSAADRGCPAPVVRYQAYGQPPEFDAPCVGTPASNGHYGEGIVDALAAVRTPRAG